MTLSFPEMGKTGSKILFKSYVKKPKTAPFYRVQKYSRCGQICRPDDLSVDRPVDRPTVIFLTVGAAGRPPSRPHPGHGLLVDRPVDRDKIQRAKLSGRSTTRSTGARSREWTLWISRPPGRPALKQRLVYVSVHISRPREGQVRNNKGFKLGLINSYKIS